MREFMTIFVIGWHLIGAFLCRYHFSLNKTKNSMVFEIRICFGDHGDKMKVWPACKLWREELGLALKWQKEKGKRVPLSEK